MRASSVNMILYTHCSKRHSIPQHKMLYTKQSGTRNWNCFATVKHSCQLDAWHPNNTHITDHTISCIGKWNRLWWKQLWWPYIQQNKHSLSWQTLTCYACRAFRVQSTPLWTSWSLSFSSGLQWGPAVFQQEQANEVYPWHILLKKSHNIMLCSYVGLLGYINILMCHGINGFNMVCVTLWD